MPKKHQEVVVRPRHQSRRAASKEALKQMQILLEDENDAVEIPDDDDEVIPIPVVVSPPKKKYKLTHRKSSDGSDREVLVLKSITPNITNHYVENNLDLECWIEELEPCQKARNEKIQEEEKELQAKLDQLIKSCKGEIIYKGDLTTLVEINEHIQKTISSVQAAAKQPNIILNSSVANTQPSSGYQLVMDPRLGLIVGTVQPTAQAAPSKQLGKVQVATNLQAPAANSGSAPTRSGRSGRKKQAPAVAQTPAPPPPVTTRSVLNSKHQSKRAAAQPPAAAPPVTRSRDSRDQVSPSPPATRARDQVSPSGPPTTRARDQVSPSGPPTTRARDQVSPVAPPTTRARDQPSPTAPPATRARPGAAVANVRPTESNVEGGLTTGTNLRPKAIVDLTSDDGRPLPDSREISFNKLQGKTFPSLVVVARPHLRVADVNSDRPKLDAKVKSVLMYAPTKFTEWLIQQGLVKSEQKCSIHAPTQLKLGMYSDVTKFPYSGGYVWISECCPQRFVSVFSGSIFEGSPHPPLVILKILYHWACQTNIQNVTQWVKVDNLYVKGMYTWLRSICTVALQSHIRQLGGVQTKVEVGVISLGTTSQDGNSRQVKVEVLGILETSSKLIRLRAIEPLADGDRNYKKRFSKILEPLAQWVHPSSIIVTDLTVDKATLHQMGFSAVVQTTSTDANNSNRTIMEYLRRIVPRMFQNTLSLLSRQIIQQFLDELVWREWFGTTSMQAFDNLVIHLAEQTRFESSQSLIVRLNRVALNPFKNWAIPTTVTPPKPADTAAKKRKRKDLEPQKTAPAAVVEVNRPPKSTSPDVPEQLVPLENYYYGTIDNYPPKTSITLNMKCPFCKETFNNNIVLMNHLFKHAHNVSKDGQMCRYCLTSVPTANDLLKHISTAHPAETKHDNGFVCLICETQYMNPFVLGKHMSKEHCPSELPYQCGTCGYRCSNHKQAIDHFYKQHDNGPTIQCPFCLKSTTVFSSSRNIVQNMNYFIQHLQKHQRKQFARRCGKCNLWFVQKDVLRDHQTKMHASQRGKTGLVPWIAPRNGVMVPKSKMDKYPCDAEGINFTTLYYNVPKNLNCKECNGPMDTPKHFPSFESCQNPNCQYSTCCSNAMQEHNAKCSKNSQHVVAEEKLPSEMFCVCGYSSDDGNQLAKHLAICERKSAYPSLSESRSASVTHSMLDVLGLVRKPEEVDKKQASSSKLPEAEEPSKSPKPEIVDHDPEPDTVTLSEDETSEVKVVEPTSHESKDRAVKDQLDVGAEEKAPSPAIESVDVDSPPEAIEVDDTSVSEVTDENSGDAVGKKDGEADEAKEEGASAPAQADGVDKTTSNAKSDERSSSVEPEESPNVESETLRNDGEDTCSSDVDGPVDDAPSSHELAENPTVEIDEERNGDPAEQDARLEGEPGDMEMQQKGDLEDGVQSTDEVNDAAEALRQGGDAPDPSELLRKADDALRKEGSASPQSEDSGGARIRSPEDKQDSADEDVESPSDDQCEPAVESAYGNDDDRIDKGEGDGATAGLPEAAEKSPDESSRIEDDVSENSVRKDLEEVSGAELERAGGVEAEEVSRDVESGRSEEMEYEDIPSVDSDPATQMETD